MRPDRPHRIRTSVVTAVACAVVVTLTVILAISSGRHSAPRRAAMPSATPSASPTGGPLRVIPGRTVTSGVRVGYPHTLQGAVSAADEFMSDIGSTLDPDRAAAVLRLTADPSYPQAPGQYAQGVLTDRRVLGLALTGPVPDGTSVVLQPMEYQVRDVSTDRVLVLLLSDYTVTVPGQEIQGRVSIDPLSMHWATGDWKILPPETTVSYTSLLVQPDSPQAVAAGWQELSP